jgi:hypothetical protein
MSAAIESNDHTYELRTEAIDAEGHHCLECGDTAPGDKLIVFSTVRGAKVRVHEGAFCSTDCHDRWYGLKAKR